MLADKTTDPTQANAEAQMAFARSRLPRAERVGDVNVEHAQRSEHERR